MPRRRRPSSRPPHARPPPVRPPPFFAARPPCPRPPLSAGASGAFRRSVAAPAPPRQILRCRKPPGTARQRSATRSVPRRHRVKEISKRPSRTTCQTVAFANISQREARRQLTFCHAAKNSVDASPNSGAARHADELSATAVSTGFSPRHHLTSRTAVAEPSRLLSPNGVRARDGRR